MTDSNPGSEFMVKITWIMEVADPDLQIRGWPGHPDPEMRGRDGGLGLKKFFFPPFRPQFGLKIRGGPCPSPGSATAWG